MTGPRMISMTGLEATGLITLGDLLANFMGAKYRKTMVNWKQVYLSIAAYGEARALHRPTWSKDIKTISAYGTGSPGAQIITIYTRIQGMMMGTGT